MAIGDVTQKKLLAKNLTTTTAANDIVSPANTTTTITSITLYNTNTSTARIVLIYGYGSAADNIIARIPINPLATEIITGLDYVIASGEHYYFTQTEGTDVHIAVMGIEEIVA